MGRSALIRIVGMPTLSLGALFVVAAVASGSGCSSSPSQPDGGPLCTQGVSGDGGGSCAAGTQCTNGDCVPTCAADGSGCPGGFYCESTVPGLNVCSPITATACATDLDCPLPQTCAPGGICSSFELRADGTSLGCYLAQVPDGCAADSVCYQVPSNGLYSNYCTGLEHCSEDGGCPNLAGGYGSVCNALADGGVLIAGKEDLCLYGYCVDNTHCPAGFECFHYNQASAIGQCQEGYAGDPCYTPADCFNSPTGCNVTLDGGVDGGMDDGGQIGVCF